jgi:hypothetical protein
MQSCLAGQHILFVGDSVTRYQFLALAQAVETGLHLAWDPITEHDDKFGTWANFFAATTERLGGHGVCDCYRPPNDAPQEALGDGGLRAWAVLGSRYYRNPGARLELTFLEALGGSPPASVWHEPRSFGVDCQKSELGIGALGGAAGACAKELLCKPGFCSSPPDHVQPVWTAIRDMVARTQPAVIVLNSGLWGVQWSEAQGGNVELLMGALDWAVASGGVRTVVWKTTTAQMTGMGGSFDAAPLATQREELVVAAFRGRGWPVLQAANATGPLAAASALSEEVRAQVFVDAVHFTRSVYRGLNELLVSMLCPVGRERGEGPEGGGGGASG